MDKSRESIPAAQSPYIPMFETFRAELDEHHDRRERVIKASRDITAASKKIIFALQRVKSVDAPIPPAIAKSIQPHATTIADRLTSVAPDLQSINAHRYARQITGGVQEWMEAQIFQHYLETQQLLTFEQAAQRLAAVTAGGDSSGAGLTLTPEDYVLGIFDATGELMRFAITNMATAGAPSRDPGLNGVPAQRTVLHDLQTLRTLLVTLSVRSDFEPGMRKDVGGKLEVALASVDKVEKALYGLVVRGSEQPKGWMPDLSDARGVEAEG